VGVRVVVSAGGTREPIDPVRFLTNRSSGKQGLALAESAARRGAEVTLVTAAPLVVRPELAARVTVVGVESASDMERAMLAAAAGAQVVVMAAAVADFRPKAPAEHKLAKGDGVPEIVLERLPTSSPRCRTPDARARSCGLRRRDPRRAGPRRAKLERKRVDLLVVNDVSQPGVGFDHDTNAVVILDDAGSFLRHPLTTKSAVADAVFDRVSARLSAHERKTPSREYANDIHLRVGHRGPSDKMADQISDTVLDALLEGDAMSRVACETLLTTGCGGGGEVTTSTYVDIPTLVRNTVCDIGYDNDAFGFNGRTCGVMVALDEQSPDIAQGVDSAFELRTGSGGEDLLNARARATRG